MRVIIAKSEEEKRLSYRLRFDTMCRDLGWLPVENYATPEEWDEYDVKQSIIFLVVDDFGNTIGTSRIILPGDIPLPIERHFDLYPMDQIEKLHGKIEYGVEISRFIVPQNSTFKNHEITQMLCMAMLNTLLRMETSHAFISADYRFFRLLNILGIYFVYIGEPKIYMGSKTIPGITNLRDLASRLEKERPFLYELLMANEEPIKEITPQQP